MAELHGWADEPVTEHGELTITDPTITQLVRGQRITVTHGGEHTGEYRVTDVTDHHDGTWTYSLAPADQVDNTDPADRR